MSGNMQKSSKTNVSLLFYFHVQACAACSCGEKGIRTLGPPKRSTVFETAPFDRSGISPVVIGLQKYDIFLISEKKCIFAFPNN